MPDIEFSVLRNTKQLQEFVPIWSALWKADVYATPFQHPAWLLPWWRHFGQPDLRAIVLRRQGRPIGLLPLYLYSGVEPGAPRKLLALGAGTTDYLDGIFAPGCTVAHVRQAFELLAAEDTWNTLDILQLRPGSLLARALAETPGVRAIESLSCSRGPARSISELPVKIRRNAMYYRNRAMRRGSLTLTYAGPKGLAQTFEELARMHTARWQQAGEPGVLTDERVLAWHREALPQLERAGLLRLCTLRLDDTVLGILYSLADPARRHRTGPATDEEKISPDGRTQYFYLTAYSPDCADLRPGTLLLALAIEQAAAEGFHTIDMLRGEETYKHLWHLEAAPTLGFRLPHPGRLASAA